MTPQAQITVVRGKPTDAELAAVVAILTARACAAALGERQTGPGPGRSAWASKHRLMRQPLRPGPLAWREVMK